MFTNLQHLPSITQAQHRALPFVSNTDLSNLADQLLGRLRSATRYTTDALTFGSHFHSAILEPAQFQAIGPELAGRARSQWTAAGELARVIKRHRYPRHVCYLGQAEQSYTATHAATGLTVKVRPDLLITSPKGRRRTLVDFKTTSCRDLAQFLETVDKYGYDRQGALYADILGAHRVVLIAVQKKPAKGQAPQVWVQELTAEQLQAGRKKYLRLLRACAELASLLPAPTSSCASPS
ncbi:MAG: PD-(D/E)XK nuclease-like domain-containing protein [Janthinobacterium lividum]